MQNHYATNSCIIFDGYPDGETDNSTATSTKASERLRRKSSSNFPTFHLEPHTQVALSQENFLSNENNKIELIKHLEKAFKFEGYSVKVAEEDADSLIVNSSIEIAESYMFKNSATGVTEYNKQIVIVGQDVDLLVLLHQFNLNNAPIYFLKVGAGKVNDAIYSSKSFKFEQYQSIIAFIHCFTGCDSTSGFAGKGKKKQWKRS